MATRQPTRAELNALLSNATATYDALVALGVAAAASTANDSETTGDGNTACRKCAACTTCRNCERCVNCSGCDDSTWLGSSVAPNGCHQCTNCHGSDPAIEGSARSVKLYGCNNLHRCSRCIFTDNIVGGRNLIYGVQVTAAMFDTAEALVRAQLGLA
jgi:hypothetical protein